MDGTEQAPRLAADAAPGCRAAAPGQVVEKHGEPQFAAPACDSDNAPLSQPESHCAGRVGAPECPVVTGRIASSTGAGGSVLRRLWCRERPLQNLRFCGAMGAPLSHPSPGVAPGDNVPWREGRTERRATTEQGRAVALRDADDVLQAARPDLFERQRRLMATRPPISPKSGGIIADLTLWTAPGLSTPWRTPTSPLDPALRAGSTPPTGIDFVSTGRPARGSAHLSTRAGSTSIVFVYRVICQ